jgi:hypothetical protein
MSKGVWTARRRILIRRWAIVLKTRRERNPMGGLKCATRERWMNNIIRSHGDIHPLHPTKVVARGDLDDIAGYCNPADCWCRSAARGRKQISKRVLRPPPHKLCAANWPNLLNVAAGRLLVHRRCFLNEVLPFLYLLERWAVVTVDDGR